MLDLPEAPCDPSLQETLYVEEPDVLPPTLLPSHHHIPKTQFPKLVVSILVSLQPTTDAHQRRIRAGQVVPVGLLSSLVVTVDKQPFVPGLLLLINWVMVVAPTRKRFRGD